MASNLANELFAGNVIDLTVDAMLTATLRTSLNHMTDLRDEFNRHPLKSGTVDVRKVCPNTYGANLLRTVEQPVTYDRLLALIAEMEVGIAFRVNNGLA